MVKLKNNIAESKDKIRDKILVLLRSQGAQERSRKSHQIKRRLFKDRSFQSARSVMFYIGKSYEVDTTGMIDEALALGKKVVVPVTEIHEKRIIPSEIADLSSQLEKGPFGVYEPKKEYVKAVKVEDIDMIIVPGIAFDKKGNRIGHGKGYFDRFLQGLPKRIPTVGLAFKFQLLDRIDTLSWDVPVAKVITA